jgi:glutamyl-tRNA reductase
VSTLASSSLAAFVTHARHVTAVERERFAERLRGELTDRALILATCHRVEVYTVVAGGQLPSAPVAYLPAGGTTLVGEPAVRHAMTVAVGGDSVVIGEDQILHQIRVSVDAARADGHLDPTLERLFALALHAGRRARSWHQGPRRSLADVALSSIERQCGPLGGSEILVVGAGQMGRLAARAASAAGARVAVANRTTEAGRTLAAATGARVEAFDPGGGVDAYAGIIVALGGPWPICAATVAALRQSRTVVVDLSAPAAVPDSAVAALGARHISADALAIADNPSRAANDGSGPRLAALIDRTTTEFIQWLEAREGRAAAQALISRADRDREAELDALWRRLPQLEPDAREAIDRMTHHLARRILRRPLERLGRDVDGRDERAIRDIFAL